MITINEHCFLLQDALFGIGGINPALHSVTEHLRFAAGIVDVKLDLTMFERQVMMCSRAEEHLAQKDDVLQELAKRLTIFNLAWSGLDCYVNLLSLPKVKGYNGKVNSLCQYLNEYASIISLPSDYYLTLEGFLNLIPSSHAASQANHRISIPPFVSEHGLGAYYVYPLRNAFAHCALVTPAPEGCRAENHPDVKLVDYATRLVLFTVQFLTLATFDHSEVVEWANLSRWDDEEDPLTVGVVFDRIHTGADQFILPD